MKKSTKTWTLLIIAVGLAAVIVLFERGLMHVERPPEHTVFNVFPESIDRLVTERDGVRIECIREEGLWRMTHPVEAAVDTAIVQQMISSMARVARGERITPATLAARGLTPAQYGFDEPRARITFRNNRGTVTWLIGRDSPLGETVYVMRESGGDIMAAPRQLLHLVPKDPAWIRDRSLFVAGDVSDVRGVDLVRTGTVYRIRQEGISRWEFREPYTGRANAQEIHHLVESLLSGRVADFLDGEEVDLQALGFDPPVIEISMFTRDERTSTLQIGHLTDDDGTRQYARRTADGSLFTVPAEWVEKVNRDPVALRSRSLTDLSRPRTDSVRIQRGEQQVALVQSNRIWRVQRPVRWESCTEQVNGVLEALLDAPVMSFIDEPTDEQTARMRSAPWEIEINSGPLTRTVRISAPSADDVRLAKVSGESSLYVIPVSAVREAYADPLFYRNPLVLSVDPVAIQQLTIRRNGEKDVVGRKADGTFGSGPDGEGPLDAGALSDLMWLLNDLRSEHFVEFHPETLDVYGLDAPKIELTIRLDDPNGTIGRIVRIGNATDGGRFAMVHGQPLVFVLSNESVQVATASLVPRDQDELGEDELGDNESGSE